MTTTTLQPVQLFLCHAPPSPKKIRPIEPFIGLLKPPWGGLWTSTYNAKRFTSAWNEVCIRLCSDGKLFRETWRQQWWLLYPREDVRVLEIASQEDYSRCLAQYGYSANGARLPDFPRMSEDYDAFHVAQEVIGDVRIPQSLTDLSVWQCESTLWFRWCFDKVEQI